MFAYKLEKLKYEINNQKSLILVEGKKDRDVLKKLGFLNFVLISGKSFDKTINEIISAKPKSVIILTDFDKEGEKKALFFNKLLEKNNIKINSFIRKKFKNLFRIHKIEEIKKFTKLFEDDYYHSNVLDKNFNRYLYFAKRNSKK